jgi:Kdo2-lipid IVA lauroyltransferase/acyltransferase
MRWSVLANALAVGFKVALQVARLTQRLLYFIVFSMRLFFRLCAKCPLWLLHAVGAALGWLAYGLSPTYRRRFLANIRQAGYTPAQVRGAIAHAGRMVAELPRLWLGKPIPIVWQGEDVFDAAHLSGQGIVFLTPHLGCFEVTGQAIAQRYAAQNRQLIALYSPSRQNWLKEIMESARDRPGMKAVSTSFSGVRTLLKSLRSGHALVILPDQVPPMGLGVWADFFGQPAYTMTLATRLAQQTGSHLVLMWGERLPQSAGYCVHFSAFEEVLSEDATTSARQINAAMERLIGQCPEQYLWGYARYKQPRQESPGAPT